MDDFKEISIDFVEGEPYFTASTDIKKYIKNAYEQKKKHPTLVDIRTVNEDGSIVFRMPDDWFPTMKPPRKGRVFTEEEKEANANRLREMHRKKREAKKNE